MKKLLFVVFLAVMVGKSSLSQNSQSFTKEEQELVTLSKQKWQWMSEKNTEPLSKLFEEKSMFVHMGGSWGKEQEINVIKSGNIWYKQTEAYNITVQMFQNTAVVLTDLDLVAMVGGNEAINPFMVTEVYVKLKGEWKLAQLTFSRLMRQVKLPKATN